MIPDPRIPAHRLAYRREVEAAPDLSSLPAVQGGPPSARLPGPCPASAGKKHEWHSLEGEFLEDIRRQGGLILRKARRKVPPAAGAKSCRECGAVWLSYEGSTLRGAGISRIVWPGAAK